MHENPRTTPNARGLELLLMHEALSSYKCVRVAEKARKSVRQTVKNVTTVPAAVG